MKIYKLILVASLTAFVFTGCSDDGNDNVGRGESIEDFALSTPANFSTITINPSLPDATIVLSWKPAVTGLGGASTYTVLLDEKGGDFSTPIFSRASDSEGTASRITFEASEIQEEINGLTSNEFIWTVEAKTITPAGENVKRAANPFEITINVSDVGISNFNYIAPALNQKLTLNRLISPNAEVIFSWSAATSTGGDVRYTWQAATSQNGFDNPVMEFDSDDDGESTTLTLTHAQITNALEEIDYTDGLFWRVNATVNDFSYSPAAARFVWFELKSAPSNMYLVGGATAAGWSPPNSIPFREMSEGHFEIFANINTGDGYKFLQVQDWAGDWGADPANPGHIIQDGEENATVSESGFYRVRLNFVDLSYEAIKTNWAIVGDATPGGWGTDTDMTFVNGHTWAIDVTLGAGEWKFRANDDWPINMGGDGGMKLRQDGSNITSPGPGSYHIELILDPVAGYSYTITPQ